MRTLPKPRVAVYSKQTTPLRIYLIMITATKDASSTPKMARRTGRRQSFYHLLSEYALRR
eukprot:TRINITY_DN34574_c0_g1_i1.p4 TRINITY_DN34574_c0_g1~~TRINITY_DN34574_c0_g1_i1.p4  ORF type:complete len:60 (-),score=9.04 TRINITY_DN34574_c0_g1_i1:366-545(-)